SLLAIPLPWSLPGCDVDRIDHIDGTLTLIAHSNRSDGACPQCGSVSTHVHSYYFRAPADLPLSDRSVRLGLRVRRFRCLNADCSRRTFAETLPDLLGVRARRTHRLEQAQRAAGLALGGQAGARLLGVLRMPTSPDTVLRLLRR